MKSILGADAIIQKDGKVLLVQQRKHQAYGLWSFPGGHVETGETPEQAAYREVQEELGVTLTNIKLFQKNTIKTETGHNLELHTYSGGILGEINLRDEELMAYGWFSLASLEEMQNKLRNPVVLDLARKALSGKRTSSPAASPNQADQIELAKKLLKTVRHAAYATINEDGTPHNSPLMLIYNEQLTKLYIGSYTDSVHSKNLIRTGKAFAVVYDSFIKNQGGVYITGSNAKECEGDELIEALRVHNSARARYGSSPLTIDFYQRNKPSQRMYSIDIAKIELYSVVRDGVGLIIKETRVEVFTKDLLTDV
jgi:8-oxo-dGTP diphosphatase